jgi:hypothetical protein
MVASVLDAGCCSLEGEAALDGTACEGKHRMTLEEAVEVLLRILQLLVEVVASLSVVVRSYYYSHYSHHVIADFDVVVRSRSLIPHN